MVVSSDHHQFHVSEMNSSRTVEGSAGPFLFGLMLPILGFVGVAIHLPPGSYDLYGLSIQVSDQTYEATMVGEFDLFEAIVRKELQYVSNEIAFVSFGLDDDGRRLEPPPEFFDRFMSEDVDIRSVVDATFVRLNGPYRGPHIASRTTWERGKLIQINNVKWDGESDVRLDHYFFGGPLSGGGVSGAHYRNVSGNWIMIDVESHLIF